MTAGPPGGGSRPQPGPQQGAELLERAVAYALGAVARVSPPVPHAPLPHAPLPHVPVPLSRPTPCQGWDLGMLLRHLNESVAALDEGARQLRVGLRPGPEEAAQAADPAAAFRAAAARLLGAWTAAGPGTPPLAVGGCPMAAGLVAAAGALEIAVHGWDVHRACGVTGAAGAVPTRLAAELLALAPVLVPPSVRRGDLFGPPVPVPSSAGPSERLVALLGRAPGPCRPEPPASSCGPPQAP
ncbi:TIGR03086 family metal-binding protein [Streptomyces sp. 549]|uniref:TIGR03086 family metal-binding protein n=1 Tax=Streptomyces sp. 549 TaxID=3049076 RepID=UPI0024C3E77B|nr:TIGR03086 family metal-binding protein [Streptomyces sp. 549]MDK1475771.1 TIGR03086 family metal-binding protein [Streptomyces sp. 549]